MSSSIGVIGLGIMGGAMARNLVKAGYEVHGFDIDERACERARAGGVKVANSASEVAQRTSDIITSLASTNAVMMTAEAIAFSGPRQCTVIETSTLPLADKLAIGELLEKAGHVPLDCPLLGTGPHAEAAELMIYASGDPAAIARLAPVFSAIGKRAFDLGAYGNGSRMKLVNNHLVAIYNVAAAETMVLGMKTGLDAQKIVDVISAGVTGRVFDFRAPMMVANRYEPATMKIEVWQKDMSAISALAASVGSPLPVFNATRAIYDAAMANGQGAMDTASTCRVLELMAGLKR